MNSREVDIEVVREPKEIAQLDELYPFFEGAYADLAGGYKGNSAQKATQEKCDIAVIMRDAIGIRAATLAKRGKIQMIAAATPAQLPRDEKRAEDMVTFLQNLREIAGVNWVTANEKLRFYELAKKSGMVDLKMEVGNQALKNFLDRISHKYDIESGADGAVLLARRYSGKINQTGYQQKILTFPEKVERVYAGE
jgi:hypothetical protein